MPCTVKKTFEIARDTGNHLLVQLKANQAKLFDASALLPTAPALPRPLSPATPAAPARRTAPSKSFPSATPWPQPLCPRRVLRRGQMPHPRQPRHHGKGTQFRPQHLAEKPRHKRRERALGRRPQPRSHPGIQGNLISVELPWGSFPASRIAGGVSAKAEKPIRNQPQTTTLASRIALSPSAFGPSYPHRACPVTRTGCATPPRGVT